MQYLQACIQVSNQNALVLQKLVRTQERFPQEKTLTRYFTKLNKIVNLETTLDCNAAKGLEPQVEQQPPKTLLKRRSLEEHDSLEAALDENAELWKAATAKIKETDALKLRLKVLEKEAKKLRDKQKQEEGIRKRLVKNLEDAKKREKEGRQEVLDSCLAELKKSDEHTGAKVADLRAKVDQLRENYNWRIEDLDTQLKNRVDVQQLETTVESLNSAILEQCRVAGHETQSCLFTRDAGDDDEDKVS